MQRTPVSSSNVASIGYDVQSRVLEVEFKSGGTYQYASVPAMTYHSLMVAASKGKYLDQHVKGRFSASKVG
jgi:hypothetical protein